MHSLAPACLAGLRFDATQLATLRAIGEHRGKQALFYQQAPEALKRLRQIAVVESCESSNRLEGVTVAANRLKAIVLKNTLPKDRSEQEVAGYRDALALIHESARDMAFTPNIMLQLHAMMYRYMPNPGGRWKQTDAALPIRLRSRALHQPGEGHRRQQGKLLRDPGKKRPGLAQRPA